MSIVGGLVVFSITWIIVMFTVLPWGVRTQEEDEDTVIQPGTVESAPVNPAIWKKFAITTVITIILFGAFLASIEYELIDYRAIISDPNRN